LARQLTPQRYGAFALAFEIFLFLTVVYGSLILEPLSVFGSSVFREQSREYLGKLLQVHAVLGSVILLLLSYAAWMLHAVVPGSVLPTALAGVAVASPCLLLFWLARRMFYVRLAPPEALRGAAIYCAVLVLGLALVYRSHLLSPLTAFLLMAAGALVTAPSMLARLRPALRAARPGLQEVIRRHWIYGRWALASAVAIWLSGAIYYPLLGGMRGLAEAGEMKALMNFASPIGQVIAALSLLSLPYASRVLYQEDAGRRQRLVWNLAAVYCGGTLAYWLVVLAFRGSIVTHLYAGRYQNIESLLPWVALGSVLRISATAHAITLRAMHAPKLVFAAYSAASVTAVAIGVPATWAFGLRGAVMTFVLSSGVALMVAWIMVHRRPAAATSPAA
jgi:O-antigen/teichoic acid export membrane protein